MKNLTKLITIFQIQVFHNNLNKYPIIYQTKNKQINQIKLSKKKQNLKAKKKKKITF